MVLCAIRRLQKFFLLLLLVVILYYAVYFCFYLDWSAPFSLFNPIWKYSDRPDLVGYFNNVSSEYSRRNNNAADPIFILTWTKVFGREWTSGPVEGCDRSLNCIFTNDRNYLNRSAAVLFHARDIVHTDLPTLKYLNQKYVFFSQESPVLTFAALSGASSTFFDWTLSYRTDSTIYCPYWHFQRNSATTSPVVDNFDLNRKTKMVAWVVSNCDTHSKRERYVYELSKYVQVNIFGDCGGVECFKNDTYDCAQELAKEHRFYISFENAVCRDYISEKFGARLKSGLVPIVLRREDYDRLVPSALHVHSLEHGRNGSKYIFIAADDYSSPKELANYLLYLQSNPDEYTKYFSWRRQWSIVEKRFCDCDLCTKLHEERDKWRRIALKHPTNVKKWIIDEEAVRHFDIHQWWNVDACDRSMAMKLLSSKWKPIRN